MSDRKLLDILDDHRFRKSYTGTWYTRYKVRHRLKYRNQEWRIKEEWYTNRYLLRVYGPTAVREKLKAYMPEQHPSTRADGTTGESFCCVQFSETFSETRLIFSTSRRSLGLRERKIKEDEGE